MRHHEAKHPVLFDIDRTLFDTERAYQALLDALNHFLESHQIKEIGAEELIERYLADSQVNHFSAPDLVRFMGSLLDNRAVIRDDLAALNQLLAKDLKKKFLHADSLLVVPQLYQKNIPLGIFSQSGDRPWQLTKIHQLEDYFLPELIFIGGDKKSDAFLSQLPHEAVIIDDKPEVVLALINFANRNDRHWQIFLIDRHHKLDQAQKTTISQQGVTIITDLLEFKRALL